MFPIDRAVDAAATVGAVGSTRNSTGGRERLERETRQGQIVAAYIGLIATRGYSATSIRDIASATGISTGTLLHHFRSKDELLTATLAQVSRTFMEAMERLADIEDPVARLRGLADELLGSERHDVGWAVWIAFWHEAAIKPELAPAASAATERSEELISGFLREAMSLDGGAAEEDVERTAAELGALIDGLAIRLHGERGRWTREQAVAIVYHRIDEIVGR